MSTANSTSDRPLLNQRKHLTQAAHLVALETETPEHESFIEVLTPEIRKALLEGKCSPIEEIALFRQVTFSTIKSIQAEAGTQLGAFLVRPTPYVVQLSSYQ